LSERTIKDLDQNTKPRGRGLAVDAAGGHVKRKAFPIIGVRGWVDSVQLEEYDTGTESRSFISVYERVVQAEVVKIGSRDFNPISEDRITIKDGLRRGHGRF
jgi:hypothetical protein